MTALLPSLPPGAIPRSSRDGPDRTRRACSEEASSVARGGSRAAACCARTHTPACREVGWWWIPPLVTRHTRVSRGRAPTCGWAATARLAVARAAFRMRLHAAAHAGTSAGGAGSRVVLTRTCHTRRAGAGATGSVRGCTGVPQAAAAAAAAPSSAARATGFWVLAYLRAGASALSSRCARAALALHSRCARAALHTRRPPGSGSRG